MSADSNLFDPAGFDLPPGPERRDALRAAGWNISPEDFTAAEREQLKAEADELIDAPFAGTPATS